MCIVIDANKLAEFCDATAQKGSGMRIIRQWIEGKGEFRKNPGKVIYSSEGDYGDEIRKVPGKSTLVLDQLTVYLKAGRARNIGKNKCDLADKDLPADAELKSNKPGKGSDRHILALANAGRATLLCTDDEGLKKDFKQHVRAKIRGKVRRGKIFPHDTRQQREILREHCCPD